MKRIHVKHRNPDAVKIITETALAIATAFASHGQTLKPVMGTESPNNWHLFPSENNWWALVEPTETGCTILIRHRYRKEMAEALMQAICHKYRHECTFE